MILRKKILESLNKLDFNRVWLEEQVYLTSDYELGNILVDNFFEHIDNIKANFRFLEMILGRSNLLEIDLKKDSELLNNEELKKLFNDNWEYLISYNCWESD